MPAAGNALTVTTAVVVFVQPPPSVTVRVYVVVESGVTVIEDAVDALDHL